VWGKKRERRYGGEARGLLLCGFWYGGGGWGGKKGRGGVRRGKKEEEQMEIKENKQWRGRVWGVVLWGGGKVTKGEKRGMRDWWQTTTPQMVLN